MKTFFSNIVMDDQRTIILVVTTLSFAMLGATIMTSYANVIIQPSPCSTCLPLFACYPNGVHCFACKGECTKHQRTDNNAGSGCCFKTDTL